MKRHWIIAALAAVVPVLPSAGMADKTVALKCVAERVEDTWYLPDGPKTRQFNCQGASGHDAEMCYCMSVLNIIRLSYVFISNNISYHVHWVITDNGTQTNDIHIGRADGTTKWQ